MQYDERQAWNELWEAVFGEPPPIASEADLTGRILVEYLPPILPYEIKPARSDPAWSVVDAWRSPEPLTVLAAKPRSRTE